MKKIALWMTAAVLAALGGSCRAQASDGSLFIATPNMGDTLFGYHIYGDEGNPRGLSLDYNDTSNPGSLGWSLGLERTYGDLYLYNYHWVNNTNLTASNQYFLRMRGDNGQTVLGPGATHQADAGAAQLQILAGGQGAARNGLEVDTWGAGWDGLNLQQKDSVTFRTRINMDGIWRIGTDTDAGLMPNKNWYLQNISATGGLPIVVSGVDNQTNINNGLSVAGLLAHTGNTLGFYGAAPTTKQVVTGCWSDGTALQSLLAALKKLGLVDDQTSP